MNKKITYTVMGLLILLLAGWLIWDRGNQMEKFETSEGGSNPKIVKNTKHEVSSLKQKNGNALQSPRTVKSSGLGEIEYARIEKAYNTNDLLTQYGIMDQETAEMRNKGGLIPTADLYFNEQGELVHISYQKGLYKTRSRDADMMKKIEEGQAGLTIVRKGIPGLTLDNQKAMRAFLNIVHDDLDNGASDQIEYEITPIIARINEGYAGNPRYIGNEYAMALIKFSSGSYSIDESPNLRTYPREEQIRRWWSVKPIFPDPESEEGLRPPIGGGGPCDEPLMEFYNQRRIEPPPLEIYRKKH